MDRIEDVAQKLLVARRGKLVKLFRSTRADEAELTEGAEPDFIERVGDTAAAQVLAGLTDRERRELEEIDAALSRIKAGTYGKCQSCGGAVGRQRLRALPEARFCLECTQDRTG